MDWKDTVMSAGDLCRLVRSDTRKICKLYDDCVVCQLNRQAELSYKEGRERIFTEIEKIMREVPTRSQLEGTNIWMEEKPGYLILHEDWQALKESTGAVPSHLGHSEINTRGEEKE